MKTFFKKLTKMPLFLPVFSMLLVMAVNVISDMAKGANAFDFFTISITQTTAGNSILFGRIIDILNRGSETAILAIGMTLVVSSSAGTDISVGSVMSLAGGMCCMLLAGFGNTNVSEYAVPLWVGILAGILVACLCGAFNGFLVSYLKIQPMVATLILFSAGRAIGLLLCNSSIVYIREPSFQFFGSYCGIFPTPILIAAVCVLVISLVLKYTALGTYVQAVGINESAARIAGYQSKRIILTTFIICGLCAGIAGIVATSRIYSADTNNIGLNLELDAILAVALGGNSLGGGKFRLSGSIIGAYTIQAITTTLYALGVSSAQAPVFKAVIVILIVAIQAPVVRAYLTKRAAAKKNTMQKEAARA
ncbi:MAG: ABC transporter permease [Eubacteriales bacterium]|nr:ABC transporter permease [Eubacteriales bacterium]